MNDQKVADLLHVADALCDFDMMHNREAFHRHQGTQKIISADSKLLARLHDGLCSLLDEHESLLDTPSAGLVQLHERISTLRFVAGIPILYISVLTLALCKIRHALFLCGDAPPPPPSTMHSTRPSPKDLFAPMIEDDDRLPQSARPVASLRLWNAPSSLMSAPSRGWAWEGLSPVWWTVLGGVHPCVEAALNPTLLETLIKAYGMVPNACKGHVCCADLPWDGLLAVAQCLLHMWSRFRLYDHHQLDARLLGWMRAFLGGMLLRGALAGSSASSSSSSSEVSSRHISTSMNSYAHQDILQTRLTPYSVLADIRSYTHQLTYDGCDCFFALCYFQSWFEQRLAEQWHLAEMLATCEGCGQLRNLLANEKCSLQEPALGTLKEWERFCLFEESVDRSSVVATLVACRAHVPFLGTPWYWEEDAAKRNPTLACVLYHAAGTIPSTWISTRKGPLLEEVSHTDDANVLFMREVLFQQMWREVADRCITDEQIVPESVTPAHPVLREYMPCMVLNSLYYNAKGGTYAWCPEGPYQTYAVWLSDPTVASSRKEAHLQKMRTDTAMCKSLLQTIAERNALATHLCAQRREAATEQAKAQLALRARRAQQQLPTAVTHAHFWGSS